MSRHQVILQRSCIRVRAADEGVHEDGRGAYSGESFSNRERECPIQHRSMIVLHEGMQGDLSSDGKVVTR